MDCYIGWCYVILRYVTTLRCIMWRYITLCDVTFRYVTLWCVMWRYVALYHVMKSYVTLHCVIWRYVTLRYIVGTSSISVFQVYLNYFYLYLYFAKLAWLLVLELYELSGDRVPSADSLTWVYHIFMSELRSTSRWGRKPLAYSPSVEPTQRLLRNPLRSS